MHHDYEDLGKSQIGEFNCPVTGEHHGGSYQDDLIEIPIEGLPVITIHPPVLLLGLLLNLGSRIQRDMTQIYFLGSWEHEGRHLDLTELFVFFDVF